MKGIFYYLEIFYRFNDSEKIGSLIDKKVEVLQSAAVTGLDSTELKSVYQWRHKSEF